MESESFAMNNKCDSDSMLVVKFFNWHVFVTLLQIVNCPGEIYKVVFDGS